MQPCPHYSEVMEMRSPPKLSPSKLPFENNPPFSLSRLSYMLEVGTQLRFAVG